MNARYWPCLERESFCRRTHAGHRIQLFVRASNQGGADELCATGWSQPARAHRTRVASERWQAEAEENARSANPDAVDLTHARMGHGMAGNSRTIHAERRSRSLRCGASLVRTGARDRPELYRRACRLILMTYVVDYLYHYVNDGNDVTVLTVMT